MSSLTAIQGLVNPNGLISFLPNVGAKPPAIPATELKQLATAAPAAAPTGSFANLLGQMVQQVNAKQAAATDAMAGLLSGQNVSLHQAMIATEEASVSFQLMVEVRNKLLESYQELMRMQI